MVCVDGRLSKLSEDLIWQYDKIAFMRPWRITAPSGAIDLTFTPFMERVAASNLWLIRSEVHQLFGHYSGQITTAAGAESMSLFTIWLAGRRIMWRGGSGGNGRFLRLNIFRSDCLQTAVITLSF